LTTLQRFARNLVENLPHLGCRRKKTYCRFNADWLQLPAYMVAMEKQTGYLSFSLFALVSIWLRCCHIHSDDILEIGLELVVL